MTRLRTLVLLGLVAALAFAPTVAAVTCAPDDPRPPGSDPCRPNCLGLVDDPVPILWCAVEDVLAPP